MPFHKKKGKSIGIKVLKKKKIMSDKGVILDVKQ